jgi:Putative prokaryotic signal transducing protein
MLPFFMQVIRIRSFDNYIEANMIAGLLESEGIQSFLQDEFTATIDPMLSNAIGGIKLVVFEKDAVRAQNVEYVSVAKPSNWITAIATFILGSYAAAPDKKYHCFSCGFEFESLEGIVNPELN